MTKPTAILAVAFLLLFTPATAVADEDPDPDTEVTDQSTEEDEDDATTSAAEASPDRPARFGKPGDSLPSEQHGVAQTDDADDATPDPCTDETEMKRAFKEAEEELEEWRDADPPEDFQDFQPFLDEQIRSFHDLQSRYHAIADCEPNTWSAAAGFRHAHLFELIAEIIDGPPLPFPEGSPEHKEYRIITEQMVTPLKARADESFNNLIHWADRHDLDNDWTDRAREKTDD